MNRYIKNAYYLFRDTCAFLYEGFEKGQFYHHAKSITRLLFRQISIFHAHLTSIRSKYSTLNGFQNRIKGLHELLPEDTRLTYSILIALDNPNPKLLKSSLISACNQSPKHNEILIGSDKPISKQCRAVIDEISALYPKKVTYFDFSNENSNEPIYNLLAQKSNMGFLLIVDQEDWLRPDLLYRYEQYLRTLDDPESAIVFCSENIIDKNDYILPESHTPKAIPDFPYYFQKSFNLRGVLLPKKLWNDIGGLHVEFGGAQTDDLYLRLNLAGGIFEYIPFNLYARREGNKNNDEPFDKKMFIKSLKDYLHRKELNWDITEEDHGTAIRSKPTMSNKHKIHVIIPFKEQKELTLLCMASLLKQKEVDLRITTVDNGSQDLTIGKELKMMGAEVLTITEPFNYSRLNNLAVENSKIGQECDLLLFLNNDVELEEDAILEMTRWIDQPNIGMVGARLHYPDGRLQHGGVHLEPFRFADRLSYVHVEKFLHQNKMDKSKIASIVHAVTAACALIKKDLFLSIGGFDEIWYPISNSDTNLAEKIIKNGLKCFYTPYASGVHHESVSRKFMLEDVESSRWLHDLVTRKNAKKA